MPLMLRVISHLSPFYYWSFVLVRRTKELKQGVTPGCIGREAHMAYGVVLSVLILIPASVSGGETGSINMESSESVAAADANIESLASLEFKASWEAEISRYFISVPTSLFKIFPYLKAMCSVIVTDDTVCAKDVPVRYVDGGVFKFFGVERAIDSYVYVGPGEEQKRQMTDAELKRYRLLIERSFGPPPVILIDRKIEGTLRQDIVAAHEHGHLLFGEDGKNIKYQYQPRRVAIISESSADEWLQKEREANSALWNRFRGKEAELRQRLAELQEIFGAPEEEFANHYELRVLNGYYPQLSKENYLCARVAIQPDVEYNLRQYVPQSSTCPEQMKYVPIMITDFRGRLWSLVHPEQNG
jgi:hypothetical protein